MTDLCRAITGFPFDRAIVLDTETTGTSPWEDDILSVSITDIDGECLFNSLIRPKRKKKWDEAQSIHGITPKMVENAPTLDQCAQKISSLLAEDRIVVGYNIEFDLNFLFSCGGIDFPRNQFDVMREFSRIHGRTRRGDGYQWVKLSECAFFYGYRFDPHDSLNDAKATAWVFRSLLSDPAYLRISSKDLAKRYSKIPIGQTTSTKNSIIELIGTEFGSMDVSATLRMGTITRGKNKGKLRYECFVKNLCVGVCDIKTMWTFRRAFLIDNDTDLPDSICVRTHLSSNEGNQRCTVSLDNQKVLLEKLSSLSKIAPEAGTPGAFPARAVNSEALPDTSHTRRAIASHQSVIRQADLVQKNSPALIGELERKGKNKVVALILCGLLGWIGGHRYYAGQIGMGVLYTLTAGLFFVGWAYDTFCLVKSMR